MAALNLQCILCATLVLLSLMGPVAAVDFSCCSQMGPSFEDVVDNLSDWPEMYVFWTVGAAAFAVALGAYVYMTMNHLSAPPNPVRNLILGIFSLLPVYGFLAYISLVLPRFSLVTSVLRESYEAPILYWFWRLLIRLMGDQPDLAPSKFWAVPPACCCCLWCKPRSFTKWHLQFFAILLFQFAFFRPASGIFLIGLALFNQNISDNDFTGWGPYVQVSGGISLSFAMWSLFIMYKLSYPVIGKQHKTTLKFVAIKLIIILLLVQNLLLGALDRAAGVFDDRPFGAEVNIDLWSNFLLVLELPFIALLLYKGFPQEESFCGKNLQGEWIPQSPQKPHEQRKFDDDDTDEYERLPFGPHTSTTGASQV